MRIMDSKVGARVKCVKPGPAQRRMLGKRGAIIAGDTEIPLVRFDEPVSGHGVDRREWFMRTCELRLLKRAPKGA